MASAPPMTVTFDDGTVVNVEPKTRDMVGAEAAGFDFTAQNNPVASMWAVAYAALQRMHRSGVLPEGLELPDTLAEFCDLADVEETTEDEDPEGNASGQEASTGS